MSIRIGIMGYGNLGRGVECAVAQNADMELKAVFTRRNPEELHIWSKTAKVVSASELADWKNELDVLIPLRRKRHRPAEADAGVRQVLQCHRQL